MAKKDMKKHLLFVNTCGVLGYISCILQWLWTAALFLPALLQNDSVRHLFIPDQQDLTPQHIQPLPAGDANIFMMIVAIIVTLVVIIAAGIILARLPIALAKTGKKAITSTSHVVVPIITRHQVLAPKKEKQLNALVQKYIKFAACVLPIILLAFMYVVPVDIDRNIALIMGCALAMASLFWFTLEYSMAKFFGIHEGNVL